jgi:hypothetical protein
MLHALNSAAGLLFLSESPSRKIECVSFTTISAPEIFWFVRRTASV